ncbi:MAG: hypothetical protein LBE71_04095, partial [Dysgonamonadaceae bacterium]|nr:hypothetical protein [Dysgonamonadaceae bacterium]
GLDCFGLHPRNDDCGFVASLLRLRVTCTALQPRLVIASREAAWQSGEKPHSVIAIPGLLRACALAMTCASLRPRFVIASRDSGVAIQRKRTSLQPHPVIASREAARQSREKERHCVPAPSLRAAIAAWQSGEKPAASL